VVGAGAPGSPRPSPAWATVAPVMDEATLWAKLRKIEALHAGTTSDGEREAARRAAERIRARLAAQRTEWRDIVMSYSLHDPWKRRPLPSLWPRARVLLGRLFGLTKLNAACLPEALMEIAGEA
jgi:hypothetical protein